MPVLDGRIAARLLPLPLLWLAAALPAAASTLACGSYRHAGGSELVVENPGQASLHMDDGSTAIRYLLKQEGDTVQVADVSHGYITRYRLGDGGKRLSTTDLGDYVLASPATCTTPLPPPPAGSCRADIEACIGSADDGDGRHLLQLCREGLPFACDRLLERYRNQAIETAMDEDLAEPEACKPESPQFDEQACRTAASEMLGKALASAFTGSPPTLPAARLQELMQLCRDHPDGMFCGKVADEHWDSGHYLLAREALQLACTPGRPTLACKHAGLLSTLTPEDFNAPPATTLPCGNYHADTGMLHELDFGDRGLVEVSFGAKLRARLEDGQVRLRHDKGGDYVFKRLDGQRLLGLDSWNRYAVYRREGGTERCAAPVAYVERPMPMDCPVMDGPDAAEACCTAGRLQGCNVVGHLKALAGDWRAATGYYRPLCEAGVRPGCENLFAAYLNTGEESTLEAMQAICERDGKGTHVACDVIETHHWGMIDLDAILEQSADPDDTE